jgi:hypothetical protein
MRHGNSMRRLVQRFQSSNHIECLEYVASEIAGTDMIVSIESMN